MAGYCWDSNSTTWPCVLCSCLASLSSFCLMFLLIFRMLPFCGAGCEPSGSHVLSWTKKKKNESTGGKIKIKRVPEAPTETADGQIIALEQGAGWAVDPVRLPHKGWAWMLILTQGGVCRLYGLCFPKLQHWLANLLTNFVPMTGLFFFLSLPSLPSLWRKCWKITGTVTVTVTAIVTEWFIMLLWFL